MADPIHQFQIQKVIDLPDVTLPVLGTVDLAITNSHIAMTAAFVAIVGFLAAVTSNAQVVPGRLQAAGEGVFGLIDNLADSIIGHDGRKYFPFVFTIFLLILGMNLLGLFLTFTATSQLAITATFALITFGLVLVVGFAKNGLGFFKLFWPMGAPLLLRPVVGLIEFVSFLLRPITLALRLFGNMLGGHVALKIFAGFVVSLGLLGLGGGVGLLAFPVAALSLGMVVALTALEFLVAFLQAFVFAVLTCIYLNDVVNLDHAH
ncbi:MAG: F0F1 ATP synthase subunit A [Brevundimonas sp.]|uniref:ATP synthase subunit a n=1 Tax=Brevundimonas albigilva TaxID=1312364 RepID=A0ABY4SM88_9CAUL|nr:MULTISPECIES: F0F1 ATP synthase subunit A [Brevundimonas]PZU53803.1 MAG: F0F1 ATP synthase subunit A [Brevundimonas sp.]UQV17910.1 F0F1 ATP synthase subunit A [Brevundimonas albigilva]URI14169.1 F0F1 ATP synthase subunit A [Brevundimonas albigilva]